VAPPTAKAHTGPVTRTAVGGRPPHQRLPASNSQYTDTQYTDTQYTDTQYTDTQYTDTQYTDTQYTDTQYTDTQYTDTQYTDTQYTDTQYTDTQSHSAAAGLPLRWGEKLARWQIFLCQRPTCDSPAVKRVACRFVTSNGLRAWLLTLASLPVSAS